jgi:hypothetical protein
VLSLVILMIEAEQPEGLSARKLVVETAKHNVLTAYSTGDGLRLLKLHPNVDAILVHANCAVEDPDLLPRIREQEPDIPLILASPFANMGSQHADFVIDSHNPHEILRLLAGEIQPRFPA